MTENGESDRRKGSQTAKLAGFGHCERRAEALRRPRSSPALTPPAASLCTARKGEQETLPHSLLHERERTPQIR